MASNNIGEDWKKALELLATSEVEWHMSADNRHKLNASERVSIEFNLEAIPQFAEANCRNANRLNEFYDMYERISVQFHLALMKMRK